MPLQGLDDTAKLSLLKKVVRKEMSLAEFQSTAKSIKNKARIAEAFVRFTGCGSWSSARRLFPKHTSEEKLAQFSSLKFKGKEIPLVRTARK